MIPSARALDGSFIDLVPINAADANLVQELYTECYQLHYKDMFFAACNKVELPLLKATTQRFWLLKRRGEKHYVGMCYYSFNTDTNSIYPVVMISPKYQGNGYGRVAIIAMCSNYPADYIASAEKGNRFCRSLGLEPCGSICRMKRTDLVVDAIK